MLTKTKKEEEMKGSHSFAIEMNSLTGIAGKVII